MESYIVSSPDFEQLELQRIEKERHEVLTVLHLMTFCTSLIKLCRHMLFFGLPSPITSVYISFLYLFLTCFFSSFVQENTNKTGLYEIILKLKSYRNNCP